MKSNHPPLTWARIEQLARAGHDQFEVLTPPRARELVESVREHFGAQVGDVASRGEEDRQTLLATLERVRAAMSKTPMPLHQRLDAVDAALASQPEAPAGATFSKGRCLHCGTRQPTNSAAGDVCVDCGKCGQPEAPAICRARGERDLRDGNEFLSRTLGQVSAERDQLAARVKELELELEHARQIVGGQPCEHEANQCTPEERQVLERFAAGKPEWVEAMAVSTSGPADWADWFRSVLQAELANRAAKAKRDDANATIARVREALENPEHTAYVRCANAREALASQPEARSGECPDKTSCAECADGPEAPKGQELWISAATHEHLIAAANARIAELDAANARADTAEERAEAAAQEFRDQCVLRKTAEQRADAAERERDKAQRGFDNALKALAKDDGSVARLLTERDQLAARVKWLEARWEESDYCTPEERNVLDACRDAGFFKGRLSSTDCERKIVAAELANRAAKAKRGQACE